MTREGQIESPAHAIARNHGIDGRGELLDGIHETLAHLGKLKSRGSGECGDLLQVRPGREEPVIARDHQGLGRRPHFLDGRVERQDALVCQTVGRVVRFKPQEKTAAVVVKREKRGVD